MNDKGKMKFIGFWDSCFFRNDKDRGGYIIEWENGEQEYLTHKQIEKIIKERRLKDEENKDRSKIKDINKIWEVKC